MSDVDAVAARLEAEKVARVFGSPDPDPGAANSPDELVRAAVGGSRARSVVASNPACPPELLAVLAEDPDPNVVLAVARNPNTPPEVLARLAGRFLWEAWEVAGNPSAPPEVLARLASCGHPLVATRVAGNPACPPGAVVHVRRVPMSLIRWAVASR